MQLFYTPELTSETKHYTFSKEESKHMVRVLRKKEDDVLHITNGKGAVFLAKITIADQKSCVVKIMSHEFQEPKSYKLHLAVAPTKMNDRYEWFLEKATEIGIDTITPIICDHSERKIIKAERFEKIIQSATKQSLSTYFPELKPISSFSDFIKRHSDDQLFIAHCEEDKKQSLKQVLKARKDVTILIGPEGDFSTKEIELALANNYIPVTLGETRLRTETAAIVACHSVAFMNEN
ncbi:Ribosomal RNA small subunit methyltransferase E [Kordia antarctica]|uniref:Ribosomal RNA small subunit methyltransferase E n=1 Tax=Kordia antarctica TaxID=1218801 RepID=A0A7L4ZGP3_9FLAO|nr:16S rRNA (uracil(1498)-N(3))-methyltransferase [Kordia antarctica]QHI35883.1 Ribosomal RNA small subunit methyltransferase E [Kordia antarctica]